MILTLYKTNQRTKQCIVTYLQKKNGKTIDELSMLDSELTEEQIRQYFNDYESIINKLICE